MNAWCDIPEVNEKGLNQMLQETTVAIRVQPIQQSLSDCNYELELVGVLLGKLFSKSTKPLSLMTEELKKAKPQSTRFTFLFLYCEKVEKNNAAFPDSRLQKSINRPFIGQGSFLGYNGLV